MRPGEVISRANGVLKHIKARRKRRLYGQWTERAEMPPEAAPKEKPPVDILPKLDKKELRLPLLYMLLGASGLILFAGLIVIALQSC
jgi:hypothetical protein